MMGRLNTKSEVGKSVLINPCICDRCNEYMWRPTTEAGEDIAGRLAAYEAAAPLEKARVMHDIVLNAMEMK